MTLLLKERCLCEIVCDTNKAGRLTLVVSVQLWMFIRLQGSETKLKELGFFQLRY